MLTPDQHAELFYAVARVCFKLHTNPDGSTDKVLLDFFTKDEKTMLSTIHKTEQEFIRSLSISDVKPIECDTYRTIGG